MTPLKELELDLDWREAEMAVLRVLLANKEVTDREKLILYRAGWTLLYAHYEGFCKFAFTVYYDALQNASKLCKELSRATQAYALSASLKPIRNLPAEEFITKILGFKEDFMEKEVSFPEVDTESNLWPTTLERLLSEADLSIDSLQVHRRALATLVSRRNKIAHGERDMITEFSYYIGFEDAIKTVMYDLAIAIDAKITSFT